MLDLPRGIKSDLIFMVLGFFIRRFGSEPSIPDDFLGDSISNRKRFFKILFKGRTLTWNTETLVKVWLGQRKKVPSGNTGLDVGPKSHSLPGVKF